MIFRISETGNVEWISSITTYNTLNEYITAVTMRGVFVYAFYSIKNAIDELKNTAYLKLTYNEGKLIWARKLIPYNPFDTATFY